MSRPPGSPSAAAQATGTQDTTDALGSVLSHAPVSETAAPSVRSIVWRSKFGT